MSKLVALGGDTPAANCAVEQTEAPKRGRGRPPESDPTESHTITVRRSRWAWLSLWAREGAAKSFQLESLFERLENVYPEGPGRIGRAPQPDQPRKARLSPSVSRAAARRGLEKADYINRACAAYEASQKEKTSDTR